MRKLKEKTKRLRRALLLRVGRLSKTMLTAGLISLMSTVPVIAGNNTNAEAKFPSIKQAQAKHATRPLSEMGKIVPKLNPSQKQKLVIAGKPVAGDGSDYVVPNKEFPILKLKKRSFSQKTSQIVDTVRQSNFPTKQIPTTAQNFDGMPNVTGSVPPDTNGDVGPNHYVQTVNTALAVWDKQGNPLLAPVALNSLWSGLGGLCETTNRGDPIVLYDSMADRWLISQFAFNDAMTDNRQCIAISQTPDPTGAYYAYDFAFSDVKFNDYPKFGVWQNGYFMSVNQFAGDDYAGVAVVAYERDAMLAGANARQVKIDLAADFPSLFSILPADHDGLIAPPVDAPNYFFAIQDDWFHGVASDIAQIFAFNINWTTPEDASFELLETLPVAAMDMNIETGEILQPNGISLDSLRGYAMYRLAYRNFGDAASMVVTHNVDADSAGQAGLRWYQIDIDNSTGDISLAQQGTYAPADGVDRWMGSIAMDAIGNVAMGFNATSGTIHPSIHYVGRLSGDADGELPQGEGIIVTGTGSQGSVQRSRWADYASMSVDPVDDCTFWYTNEYYKAEDNDTLAWATRVGSFKFPNCTAMPTGYIEGQVLDAETNEPVANIRVNAGGVATNTDANGEYSLRMPLGEYDVTLTGYWYDTASETEINVTEDETTTVDVTLTKAETTLVNGVVSDGSGKGWPVYSELVFTIPNEAEISVYTNPFDGSYSVELVPGIAVPLEIKPKLDGYVSQDQSLTPEDNNGSFVQDYSVLIDSDRCVAPGYISNGLFEGFESNLAELGWQSVDENDSGASWGTTANGRSNLTGGSGEAALMDSDAAGEVLIDTSLVSPTIIVADLEATTLTYFANYQTFTGTDRLDLDISIDGDRWQNITSWNSNHGQFNGPGESVSVDLASFITDATSFQVRWHYYNANFEWFAQIDNVALSHTCTPIAGGSLVAGLITDENTGESVSAVNASAASDGISFTTDDTNLGGQIYFVFADESADTVTLSKTGYADFEQTVSLANNQVIRVDAVLSAPQLTVTPNPLVVEVPQGVLRAQTLTVENSGTVDGIYRIFEVNAQANAQLPMQGRFDVGLRYSGPKDHLMTNASKIRDYRPPYVQPMAPGDITGEIDIDRTGFSFGVGIDQSNGDLWFGSLSTSGFAGDDSLQRYLSDGTRTEQSIDMTSILDTQDGWFGDLAYNSRTETLWATELDDAFCIHEVDTVAMALTENSICPEGIGESQQGLAYDPITNTYFSGSWSDGLIHRFNPEGELISSINTGLAIAGLAYHPRSNRLYVAVNASAPEFDIVVLNADDYSVVGGFNVMQNGIDQMGDLAQGGLSIACDGSLWMVEQEKVVAFNIDVEESDACSWADIPWVNGNIGGTAAADSSSEVEIEFDTRQLALGNFQGQLIIEDNSPYGITELPLSLTVVEPNRGTVGFEVTSIEVNEEQEVSFNVTRTEGKDFAVSIDFTTVNGTAVAGTDYTETTGTLNWDDNDEEAKTIVVPIGTINNHKAFALQLSNPQGGVELGANARIEISVLDKPKGSGSLAIWGLLLLSAGILRRGTLSRRASRRTTSKRVGQSA